MLNIKSVKDFFKNEGIPITARQKSIFSSIMENHYAKWINRRIKKYRLEVVPSGNGYFKVYELSLDGARQSRWVYEDFLYGRLNYSTLEKIMDILTKETIEPLTDKLMGSELGKETISDKAMESKKKQIEGYFKDWIDEQ